MEPFSSGRSGSPTRHDNKVISHPPFNVSTQRFNKHDLQQAEGPEYHVAYRDMMQPTKRSTKGWSAMDDAIKPKRGTGAGKVFSSLAPQTAPPAPGSQLQPIYTSYPNETRLQELLDLQRRRLGQAPGPGQYDVTGWQPSKTCFRRQALPQLDGPFLPPKETGYSFVSTRDKEMEASLLNPDSGIAPGEYNGHACKDLLMKSAPAPKIGTGRREGKVAHPKSLSISRSIQHGIDWHIPVLVQVRPAGQAEAARKASPPRETSPPVPVEWEVQEGESPPRYHVPEPPLPPPVGGKAPPPPAAVARSVRRPLQGAPSEWDWQRLGHNYRNNWTTLHGGAFSQGDRSTVRRDMQQTVDAVDFMGPHTESIDPSCLPREALGDMFPIPEEGVDGVFSDIHDRGHRMGPDVLSRGSDGRVDGMGPAGPHHPMISLPSTASSALPTPGTSGPGLGLGAYVRVEPDSSTPVGGGGPPPLDRLLTQAEVARREAAMQAAMQAQQAAMRRAAWQAKAAGMVF